MKYILLAVLLFIAGCDSRHNDISQCATVTEGSVRLVAYRVAKSSRLWVEDVETKTIYRISSLGGRREPSVPLGTIIPVNYCDGHVHFNKQSYVRRPLNSSTRFVYMDGYSYL